MGRIRNLWVLLGLVLFTVSICDFHVSADVTPSENECRPYIEKAIHELKSVEAAGTDEKESKESTEAPLDDNDSKQDTNDSIDNEAVPETGIEDDGIDSVEDADGKSLEEAKDDENQSDDAPSQENQTEENASVEEAAQNETAEDATQENEQEESKEQEASAEETADDKSAEPAQDDDTDSKEQQADEDGDSKEQNASDGDSKEQNETETDSKEGDSKEQADDDNDSKENAAEDGNESKEDEAAGDDANDSTQADDNQDSTADDDDDSKQESSETENEPAQAESLEEADNQTAEDSKEDDASTADANDDSKENDDKVDSQEQNDTKEDESVEETVRAKRSIPDEAANDQESTEDDDKQDSAQNDDNESQETANESQENATAESQETANESQENAADDANESQEKSDESKEAAESTEGADESKETVDESQEGAGESQEAEAEESDEEQQEESPEEDLTMEFEIPKNLRPRGHVGQLLGLDAESSIKENALKRTGDVVLKELKRVFDNAIKPLESMYKYRDLSNRHFGDPEIFSKPLILFMGPWSGGKSTILNYLTDNEYTPNSIRSGAEPSPAYFNILMHGDEPEVLDGTQLAADWTFSGLQKFGQGLMDRLRGQKLPSKLLERVNIVEIPGILEVRKQVSRYFPFNDACQWFIDRADIIFLVYDPSKLDVGPETEAILDQLKGREYQTRILLNKADQVKPEELLRVQGALIWNISPLMSSAQPPVMYTVSLWSHPFENGAPIRLLQAQERAFLADLREAIDRRIENKIASARRFAVRIRNHAKMVDCYLTTYYNQKGLFSNKKHVSDKIIEHPQNYNIYEGLSTLTNISRYDLPDPEVYLDFFRLNPLYEFKKLSETCTYFKGCPINKLDIAIAYDLPELVGKYKKLLETNLAHFRKEYDENCNQTEPEPPVKIIKSR